MLFHYLSPQMTLPKNLLFFGKFLGYLGCFSLVFFLTITTKTVAQTLQISPGMGDLAPISGVSGGPNNSGDCGYIGGAPNVVLQVTEDIPFWRIRVQTQGVPTLLVQGPTGRFCVLPDRAGSGIIDLSGFGNKGSYSIFIGDRSQGQHPFTLMISPNR